MDEDQIITNLSAQDTSFPEWNKLLIENENLRMPNVEDASLTPWYVDPETNEVHIDNLIIRVPVEHIPPTEEIVQVDAGTDPPFYMRSIPINVETTVRLDKDFTTIDEETAKGFILVELANLLQINDYYQNMYSFWILDNLGTMIWDAQKKNMMMDNQATLINWFFYFIRSIKYTNLPRKDFFNIIRPLFVRTDDWMNANLTTSIPRLLGKPVHFPIKLKHRYHKKLSKENIDKRRKTVHEQSDTRHSADSQIFYVAQTGIMDIGQDLKKFADLIYNVFSGRLEYEIIREVFWNEPLVETVQLSDRLMIPKPLKSKPIPPASSQFENVKSSIARGGRRQSAKKKSIAGGRKSVSRKSVSRKSVSRKSVSRKSVSRKSVSRKSVSRKSVSRKSVSRKSLGGTKKGGPTAKGQKKSEGSGKSGTSQSISAEAQAKAAAEKARKEEQTCLQFLTDAVDNNFVKSLFSDVDFRYLPEKFRKLSGLSELMASKKSNRRQSTKKSIRRQSAKKSIRRQSAKKSIRRQSAKKSIRRQSKKK